MTVIANIPSVMCDGEISVTQCEAHKGTFGYLMQNIQQITFVMCELENLF